MIGHPSEDVGRIVVVCNDEITQWREDRYETIFGVLGSTGKYTFIKDYYLKPILETQHNVCKN